VKLDRLAILLSGICLVHCLAIPVALILLPAFGGVLFESHELFHVFLLAIGVPVSILALWSGYRRHGDRACLVIGALGLGMMLLGITHAFGDTGEIAATVTGAVVLTVAHLLNMRLALGAR
jgi:hypothetical protein